MDRRQRFRALRSVEAAAIAGLAHSGLSLAATALLLDAPDPADGDAELAAYLNDSSNQARAVTLTGARLPPTETDIEFID